MTTDVTTATYLARSFDTPANPFTSDGALRAEEVAIVVVDGVITERVPVAQAASASGGAPVLDLRADDGILLPGMVDTHVHYPQVRAMGGLGMPLLDWLERCALPEEVRLADVDYARAVAEEFVSGLVQAGTTSALVFGSHYASAMDSLFTEADQVGLRITSGQVLSDRLLREELHTTPERALVEGRDLIERWHGKGRLRYAATPRFSLSCTDSMLEVCAELMGGPESEVMFTSHLNENRSEVEAVLGLFPDCTSYLQTYAKHGLIGPRSVLAHNVHATDDELAQMGAAGAIAAHCPTSNSALGSGLFPLRRHLDAGVRVAIGSDVGAGTGFSLLQEGLQAYFMQQLSHDGYPLTPAHLLYLVTAAGADALGLADQVGDLGVGKKFDAVLLRPDGRSTFGTALRHARDDADALAKAFVLGCPGDVVGVWVDGRPVMQAA
ncbi:MAG: guanine deaminase [Ornithinimicrobium sp.]|uniref:guanine deaminase n=1 Tax=Ornithinimicrobium sp. TaxID=1977084 RepID=UPI0026DF560B|nr:guanine deaminase [Ornithinimicrobium sp.]MDO5740043.1 guanine deaminase [Ornithinimicrobium sp.]